MTKRPTHYDVLKIVRDAPAEVVRAAYKAMALKYHPDTNKGPKAHEHMESINAAYAILSNAARRERYDQRLRQQDSVHSQSSTRHANQYTSSSKGTKHTQQDEGKDTSSNYSGPKSHHTKNGNSSEEKSRETFTGIILIGLIFTALLIIYSNQTKVVASYPVGGQYRSSSSFFPAPKYEPLNDSIGFYTTGGSSRKIIDELTNKKAQAAFAKEMNAYLAEPNSWKRLFVQRSNDFGWYEKLVQESIASQSNNKRNKQR